MGELVAPTRCAEDFWGQHLNAPSSRLIASRYHACEVRLLMALLTHPWVKSGLEAQVYVRRG